jgi:hypothetical protein
MEKCRQYTVYHINKHGIKTKVFLYLVKHNSVKRYWGVEVKFPLNEAHSRCGHAGIKKNPGHPTMFKTVVGSTLHVPCQQTVVLIEREGFTIAMFFRSFTGKK